MSLCPSAHVNDPIMHFSDAEASNHQDRQAPADPAGNDFIATAMSDSVSVSACTRAASDSVDDDDETRIGCN